MPLKPLRLIAVGRLRTPHWIGAAEHYVTRNSRWRQFIETDVRDGNASLPILARNAIEGKEILAALNPEDIPICLDEHGKSMTTETFASFLQRLSENASRRPCFIIGGAFGLAPDVLKAAAHVLALGPMTLPHELARVLLLEQIYRAESIIRGLPYHHA